MTTIVVAALAIVLSVVTQYVIPNAPLYHDGWYNVLIIACIVFVAVRTKRVLSAEKTAYGRVALALVAFGVSIIGFAGSVSGLLAPDSQTIVGAPGSTVRADSLSASLVFPLARNLPGDTVDVALERGSSAQVIGHRRMTGSFLLREVPRDVVGIAASNASNAHLTITQPTGVAFLSPVLLMQLRQTIAGLSLPYDSFAVPAAHRIVKAVLFSPREAASMPVLAGRGGWSVLFDVEDDMEREVPHGIGVVHDGDVGVVGNLRLRPRVFRYPAIEIIAVPNLPTVVVGLLLVLAGATAWVVARIRFHS